MRKIDADAFREELIRDRNNDVNMYHSHIDKEIRDEKYDFAIEELDNQPTVDDWIPCSERLPEMFEQVLVSQLFNNEETNVTTASRIPLGTNDKWFWCSYDHKIHYVVAWQSLPKSYEGV